MKAARQSAGVRIRSRHFIKALLEPGVTRGMMSVGSSFERGPAAAVLAAAAPCVTVTTDGTMCVALAFTGAPLRLQTRDKTSLL